MYISKVKIKNYRSIKDLTINFNPSKNIIVGKNNSGKSNIIKAINIVLGENIIRLTMKSGFDNFRASAI